MHDYIFDLSMWLFISSPYVLVFNDDRVIRYTGAHDVAGRAGDA